MRYSPCLIVEDTGRMAILVHQTFGQILGGECICTRSRPRLFWNSIDANTVAH